MKIGYQTIIWGERLDDLDVILDAISRAGYEGVEFAQRTDAIAKEGHGLSIEMLLARLKRFGLSLIGLANGTLAERMQFCGRRKDPHYLYVDRWDPVAVPAAILQGFNIALHVHAYMGLRSVAAALELIEQHQGLKWIPDTGHLQVLGEDILNALKVPFEQVAAVHLKDWTPAYGRSPHRYSRGFTELGEGIVPLLKVVQHLQKSKYVGWLVVEQDCTRTDPFKSLLLSAQWLHRNGLLKHSPQPAASPVPLKSPERSPAGLAHQGQLGFLHSLLAAEGEEPDRCYQYLARSFSNLLSCHLITLWVCSPAHDVLSLVAVHPEMPMDCQRLDVGTSLTGIAVERHAETRFDLTHPQPGKAFEKPDAIFGEPDLICRLDLKEMISLPILNSHNKNHVRLVVNLFPKLKSDPAAEQIRMWMPDVARVADVVLDQTCAYAAASATFLVASRQTMIGFAEGACHLIQRIIGCEGVTLFMVNPSTDRLEVLGTTGIQWYVPSEDRFYDRGQGLTGRVWQTAQTKVSARALEEPERVGKSSEIVEGDLHSCLWVPVMTAGANCIGVVRCQNKRIQYLGGFNIFSDDDIAIIESVAQVASSHLQVLIAERLRNQSLERLTHELERPATAIKGAVQLISEELRRRDIRVSTLMPYDYIADIGAWSELMIGLVENADFFATKGRHISLDAKPTFLMADVIAPAVRQIEILLKDRGFAPRRIGYSRLSRIPALWVDRNRMQQVVFNLLSNSIKYAFRDKDAFQIQIGGERRLAEFRLFFRDWGEGIPAQYLERVFVEGFRAPRHGATVKGHGLGLWIVRTIVAAHGGRIEVTRRHLPTEISIFLPLSLETQPPAT